MVNIWAILFNVLTDSFTLRKLRVSEVCALGVGLVYLSFPKLNRNISIVGKCGTCGNNFLITHSAVPLMWHMTDILNLNWHTYSLKSLFKYMSRYVTLFRFSQRGRSICVWCVINPHSWFHIINMVYILCMDNSLYALFWYTFFRPLLHPQGYRKNVANCCYPVTSKCSRGIN